MVQGHFGVIQCTCFKIACISKWLVEERYGVILRCSWVLVTHILGTFDLAGRIAKATEIWKSGTLTHVWGAVDLVGFKVILGSFGALLSKCLATVLLAVERNSLDIWDSGTL